MVPTLSTAHSSGEVSVVEAQAASGDTWYKMKLFMRQPWFIGTMGAVAWLILLVVVVLLYRQRRNKKKAKSPTRGDISICVSVLLFLCLLSGGARTVHTEIFFNNVFLAHTPVLSLA